MRAKRSKTAPLAGFPIAARQFGAKEARAYFGGDNERITCLLCGRSFRAFGMHLTAQGISAGEYRQMYGLPNNRGLCGLDTKAKYAEILRKNVEAGLCYGGNGNPNFENDCRIKQRRQLRKPRTRYQKEVAILWLRPALIAWDELAEEIIKLRASGWSYKRIGDKLGVSKTSMIIYCKKNRIGSMRRVNRPRATLCKKGHSLADACVYPGSPGKRWCRECQRIRNAKRRGAKDGAASRRIRPAPDPASHAKSGGAHGKTTAGPEGCAHQ